MFKMVERKYALKVLIQKFGYKNMRLSAKEKNYIFKTDNSNGIKSRFVEIYLKRRKKRK